MAIGLTVYRLMGRKHDRKSWWKTVAFVSFLSIMPDLDVLFGLILQGNGVAFHRGPTHSLFFAICAGWPASHAWRLSSAIPRVDFITCGLLVLSHVIADAFTSPISFFWPFEMIWSSGHSGWLETARRTFLFSFNEYGIIVACLVLLVLLEMLRRYAPSIQELPKLLKKRGK
jgi:hypothetical protein